MSNLYVDSDFPGETSENEVSPLNLCTTRTPLGAVTPNSENSTPKRKHIETEPTMLFLDTPKKLRNWRKETSMLNRMCITDVGLRGIREINADPNCSFETHVLDRFLKGITPTHKDIVEAYNYHYMSCHLESLTDEQRFEYLNTLTTKNIIICLKSMDEELLNEFLDYLKKISLFRRLTFLRKLDKLTRKAVQKCLISPTVIYK